MSTTPDHDAKRRSDKPWRAWYNTARWRTRRTAQLTAQPDCQRCKERGIKMQATIAHHVVKHNGNEKLFWFGKLRSDCKQCHDSLEQRVEVQGYEFGCDDAGRPVAKDHPWNIDRLKSSR